VLASSSKKHYFEHGRKKGIWAFKDRKVPKNIMKILQGDYVVFVCFKTIKPGRAIHPFYKGNKIITEPKRGIKLNTKDIFWSISLLDSFRVSKGYHLDFTSKSPYEGFDETWKNKKVQLPAEKEYTQFIRMKRDKKDPFQYYWEKPEGFALDRKLFPASDERLLEFVKAMRISYNTQGDALDISRGSFEALIQLLSQF